ncbi:MAG: helix-turn-helix transcriptional regulator [Candidatus Izimaplasma sp.]|nr:helix-turn-helix transcriptional regulator [Candidatus Izimaplasma bacterium]
MENDAREFGLFIDGLRLERSISREDLCEGIMSLSQYKRYLKGDTSIPNGKLVQIAERLKFSIADVHLLFSKKHNEELNKIYSIYRLIRTNSYKEAYKESQLMKKDVIVSEYNKLFFDFCLIKLQHALKMVSDVHVLQLYSNLIDYPNCANNDSFNIVEISALIEIVTISSNMDNFEPSQIMYRILSSSTFSYSSSGDSTFLPIIYSSLSGILGMQGENEKVIAISQNGIDYCLSHETFGALSHLLFYNSLAYLYLGNRDFALKVMKKAFMQLFLENSPKKFETFKLSFEKEFEMKIDDLIKF